MVTKEVDERDLSILRLLIPDNERVRRYSISDWTREKIFLKGLQNERKGVNCIIGANRKSGITQENIKIIPYEGEKEKERIIKILKGETPKNEICRDCYIVSVTVE